MEYSNGVWKLSGAEVRLLNECRSRDATRETLNGCWLGSWKSKAAVATTDGHRAVILFTECEHSGPEFVLSNGDLSKLKVGLRDSLVINTVAKTAEVAGLTVELEPLDGRFPALRDVVPDYGVKGQKSGGDATPVISMNPKYLKALIDVGKVVGSAASVSLMVPNNPLSPMLWVAEGNDVTVLYTLMPMRR